MPERSALATLQRWMVFGLAGSASLAAAWHWSQGPLRALGIGVTVLLLPVILLGVEVALMARVSRGDPAPRPTAIHLIRAWLTEATQFYRVFCWRQPFRWRACPDEPVGRPGQRGIVFIHGFVCNRGLWTPWMERLQQQGRAFIAVNLEPVYTSIDDYAPIIEDAVRRLTAATGLPPVLVCHSMGGLAARAWLRWPPRAVDAGLIVTIGTPHHGTWLARFGHTINGRQMRIGSNWLAGLERDERAVRRPPMVCWYSNCDNIVFPPGLATQQGADNRMLRGAAHVDLAFQDEVLVSTLGMVAAL